ncbi:MAG TPA: isoaspartyl peptidase/L-asparaginase, partial [Bacteroidota bacterium]|nr:isoaspartyl peptidase/L-asparaginase [Bacteroidota bacterium]
MDRRKFIQSAAVAGTSAALFEGRLLSRDHLSRPEQPPSAKGIARVVSTWDFKVPVNETAFRVLKNGGSLLDAVEQAINIVEADPTITSVGRGGYPDRDGHLTLDACIMDQSGNAGAVACI